MPPPDDDDDTQTFDERAGQMFDVPFDERAGQMFDAPFNERAGQMFDEGAADSREGGGQPSWMQGAMRIAPGAAAALDGGGSGDGGLLNDPRLKEMQGQYDKLQADRRAALDPLYKQAHEAIQQPTPEVPTLEKGPKAPQQQMGQGAMEFLQVATVFGALAGLLARRGTTTSLNAFGAAVKGFTEGNAEVFKQKSQEWKQATDEVRQNNQDKLSQYNAIWKDRKMNIDQKMEEIKIVASQFGDEITYNLASQRNYTALAQANEKDRQFNIMYGDKADKLHAEVQKIQEQVRVMKAQNDPNSLEALVQLRLTGDKSAANRVPFSARGQFSQMLGDEWKKRSMTADDQAKIDEQYVGDTAAQRMRGSMETRVKNATNEVSGLIPLALESSENLPRGKFVPINRIKQAVQKGSSNPQYNDFLINNMSLVKAYGRAMNPQGIPRVSEAAEAKADGLLDMAASPEAYRHQVYQLWKEIQVSNEAVEQTRSNKSPDTAFPGTPPAGTGGGGGDTGGWKVIK